MAGWVDRYSQCGRCIALTRECGNTRPSGFRHSRGPLNPVWKGRKLGNGKCRPLNASTEGETKSKDETDRGYHPWLKWASYEAPSGKIMSPLVLRHTLGLNTWRLAGMVSRDFEYVVSETEGLWRQLLLGDLQLLPVEEDQKFIDSLDPDGSKGEGFTRSVEEPKPGEPGYPRLLLENRFYQSKKFRKMHVELANRQDGMEVLHVAVIPRLEYDLPIFCVDMVSVKGRMTFGCIDVVPASMSQQLPEIFETGLPILQQNTVKSNRKMPDWFHQMCSSQPICFVPKEDKDIEDFTIYVALLSKLYLKTAEIWEPAPTEKLEDIRLAHKRFRDLNIQNEKTRAVLAKSFGDDMAMDYFKEVLFDAGE